MRQQHDIPVHQLKRTAEYDSIEALLDQYREIQNGVIIPRRKHLLVYHSSGDRSVYLLPIYRAEGPSKQVREGVGKTRMC